MRSFISNEIRAAAASRYRRRQSTTVINCNVSGEIKPNETDPNSQQPHWKREEKQNDTAVRARVHLCVGVASHLGTGGPG